VTESLPEASEEHGDRRTVGNAVRASRRVRRQRDPCGRRPFDDPSTTP